MSLTRTVAWMRSPFLLLLSGLELLLAFGRVGSILFGRWVERRQRIAAERQAAMEEAAAQAQDGSPVYG